MSKYEPGLVNKHGVTLIEFLRKEAYGNVGRCVKVWSAECPGCGAEFEVNNSHFPRIQSCGCALVDFNKQCRTTHGLSGTKTHGIWAAMISRCTKEHDKAYPNYGGRGIGVCERWKEYPNFLEDMGEKPDRLTLERIDTNKDYSPDNCVWADWLTQANNRRDNVHLTYLGKTQTIAQWAREYGIPACRLRNRIFAQGWGMERALTEPKRI